jgi:hypothetical protein
VDIRLWYLCHIWLNVGHVEEFPNKLEISHVTPIPTNCCEEYFIDDISSTQGSCQEEAVEDKKNYSELSQDQEPYP